MTEGLVHFTTRADRLRYDRAQAGRHAYDARKRKHILTGTVANMVWTFRHMLDCGVSKDAIKEALAGLIDAVSNADHAANVTIDNAGEHFDPIDLAEAKALLAKLSVAVG